MENASAGETYVFFAFGGLIRDLRRECWNGPLSESLCNVNKQIKKYMKFAVFLHTQQTAPFGRTVNFNDLFKCVHVSVCYFCYFRGIKFAGGAVWAGDFKLN